MLRNHWMLMVTLATIICIFLLATKPVPAHEVVCYQGLCGNVVNGVVHVPASVFQRFTRAQLAAARLYARKHGIRWKIVR